LVVGGVGAVQVGVGADGGLRPVAVGVAVDALERAKGGVGGKGQTVGLVVVEILNMNRVQSAGLGCRMLTMRTKPNKPVLCPHDTILEPADPLAG
jgi:hypothetical protein